MHGSCAAETQLLLAGVKHAYHKQTGLAAEQSKLTC